jgi:hypothetical protein
MRSETKWPSGLQGYRPICGNEPLIHASCPSQDIRIGPRSTRSFPQLANRGETRGDIIRGLWTRGTDCIIDVRVTDTDARAISQRPQGLGSSREKRRNTSGLPRATSLSLFVVSTDGLIGENLAEEAIHPIG